MSLIYNGIIIGIATSDLKKNCNGFHTSYCFNFRPHKKIEDAPEIIEVRFHLGSGSIDNLPDLGINNDFNIGIGDKVHVKGILYNDHPHLDKFYREDSELYSAIFELSVKEIWNETLNCGYCQYQIDKIIEQDIKSKIVCILNESPQNYFEIQRMVGDFRIFQSAFKSLVDAKIVTKLDNFQYALSMNYFKKNYSVGVI